VTIAATDASTKAGTAYSNAVAIAATDASTKAGTAYTNAIAIAATDASTKAGTAYSNAIAIAATDASTKAGTAYSNAAALAANASYMTNGTVATARLASGTANTTTYLRGDQTWATVSGGSGTVTSVGTSGSINGLTLTGGTITTTGTITLGGSITSVSTSGNFQMNSLGVGTAASATAGDIRATTNITAYYSDRRLKENITPISDALSKVMQISGVTFNSNDTAAKFGYIDKKSQVGVIAQEIEAVLPQIVVPAPFDIGQNDDGTEYSLSGEDYKTVQYEKIVPLLIEAIKELVAKVEKLEAK
jgi:hypothetical protein